MSNKPCCGNCAFFVPNDRIPINRDKLPEGFGECRRRAPSGMSATLYSNPGEAEHYTRVVSFLYPFPPVPPVDWCGEHMSTRCSLKADGDQ